ncbi:MAG TPA: acyl-CoA thioester hydrolase/BAAT C-terminal domain-containing protein [Vicinamibacterales bacterium]|nr:acyl-CoA thioester hydrolase/BAAT C-terminal domain-containing protein [Vicinamibacterales bacterium]
MNIEIVLTPTTGPIDEPLHGFVRGLPQGECVTVRAELRDSRNLLWRSHRALCAGRDGVAKIDADELIASMAPSPDAVRRPFDTTSTSPLIVALTAECGGRVVAAAAAKRLFVAADVLTTRVREPHLSGVFFQPASIEPRPAVIVLGGSSGALAWSAQVAALLARHGFAALALAYFGVGELPPQLVEIPLEYFAGGFEWLIAQPGVRPDALGVVGISRGAELALTLGSRLPYVRSVVAYCPSSVVWNGLYGDRPADLPAWTTNGRSIPFFSLMTPALSAVRERVFRESPVSLTPLFDAAFDGPLPADVFIPVEHTNGPILLVSGDDDRMWPASYMGQQIMNRLAAHGHPFSSRHVRYPDAGHLMRPPGVSTSVLDGKFALGGKPRGQAAANRAAWLEAVAFLRESLAGSLPIAGATTTESSPCR